MNHIEKNQMTKKSDIGKIKYSLFVLLTFLPISVLLANNEDLKQRIDEIKLNEEYIFGEGFNEDKEIAYGNALSDLLIYGNELKKERSQQEISLSDLQLNVETLDYYDGKRYEVIVYIPLRKLFEVKSKSSKGYNDMSDMEIEEFLISQDNFTEIRNYLSSMKQSGRIIKTGATDDISSLPENANLILIDGLGGILSVLSPEDGQGRFNFRTRLKDEVNNYSDCRFIVWYVK